MAYGMRVILGFTNDQFREISKIFDIVIDLKKNEIQDNNSICNTISKDAIQIRNDIFINDLNFVHVGNRIFDNSIRKNQEYSDMYLSLYYDPYEMNEDEHRAIVGIDLQSSYFPTFIDWRHPRGGGSMAIFNKEASGLIEKFKNELSKKYPIFNDSQVIVKPAFY